MKNRAFGVPIKIDKLLYNTVAVWKKYLGLVDSQNRAGQIPDVCDRVRTVATQVNGVVCCSKQKYTMSAEVSPSPNAYKITLAGKSDTGILHLHLILGALATI